MKTSPTRKKKNLLSVISLVGRKTKEECERAAHQAGVSNQKGNKSQRLGEAK